MKIKLSTVLSILLCAALIAAAVCVGAYRGWSSEREEALAALSADGEMPALLAEDFNQQLNDSLTGKLAMLLGVEPLYPIKSHCLGSVTTDTADVLSRDTPAALDTLEDAAESFLSQEDQETGFSFIKVFLTIVLLMVIFGNRRKKGGIPFGKILAAFTLFKLWKRR